MTDSSSLTKLNHSRAYLALPWYVNDSVNEAERQAINHHLQHCLTCRLEVEHLKQLSCEVVRSNQDVMSSHHAFSRLRSQIINNTTDKTLINQWYTERIQHIEHAMLKTGSLIIVTILVLSLAVFAFIHEPAPGINRSNVYRTLSTLNTHIPDSMDIRVVFSKDIRPLAIQHLLESIQAEIVSGPSQRGAYRIRLAGNELHQNQLQALQTLRSNPKILMAEPAISVLENSQADSQ